jgi:hypothetical protein
VNEALQTTLKKLRLSGLAASLEVRLQEAASPDSGLESRGRTRQGLGRAREREPSAFVLWLRTTGDCRSDLSPSNCRIRWIVPGRWSSRRPNSRRFDSVGSVRYFVLELVTYLAVS